MIARPTFLADADGLAPGALLAQAGALDALVTPVLVVVVTAVLVGSLILVFRAASRIQERLTSFFGSLHWRFSTRYLAALVEKHRGLRLIGIYNSTDMHPPPRLQQVYVTLRVAAAGGEDGSRLAWSGIFQPGEKRLVILGSPGAGKSTLLDYLVLAFTGHLPCHLRTRLGPLFPLYARLRDLGAEGAGSLKALLAQAVLLTKIPTDFPKRRLQRGGCLVLLDGLDEVLDEERHAWAVEEIGRLVGEYPDNHYVITCRTSGWHNQLPDFRTYEIQPFTRDDIRQCIGGWYREVPRTLNGNRMGTAAQAEELWQDLAARADLLHVASTPLLLSMIVLMHFHRQADFPQGRAKLYERCVEILLDLWDRQDKQLRLPEKRMVLGAVAFHFLKENRLEADLPELRGMVEPLLPRIAAQATAEGLIHQICERSGFLQEQRLGRFGFAHRAFHDFFGAAYVVEQELDALLVEHAGEERWREVILFAAGLAPAGRAQRLAGALLTRPSESVAELEMAGLILAEDVQLGADLQAEVRRRLLDRLSREEVAGPFRRLAEVLMAADLDGARRWMEEELRGHDPLRLRRVLELLPDMREVDARPLSTVILRLAGEGADLDVRTQALRALGGLKIPFDAEVRQVLEKARQEREPALRNAAAWMECELGRPEDLGLVKVPAGEFLMGSVEEEYVILPEQPQHTVYLPSFYIGRYPVTVGAFSQFLASSGHKLQKEGYFREWNHHEDHPVVRVGWTDAVEYARWHGMSLPSEAEWEKAARGTDGRRYPWGNEWKAGHANTLENWPSRRQATTLPVGSFSPQGDSPYGCSDMVCNVWEWTRSLSERYPYDPADGREDLQADPFFRVLRGSALDENPKYRYARCAVRSSNDWRAPLKYIGFRLVLTPFYSVL